ncbi:uncharacterized protein LOC110386633 [Bombyx mori]|uniref:Uncharacterized protein n=1 Tax=Bombyx mori TaxID=7091 RepID=A0A8R2QR26_BOMMO|nr:uncharacterized protein LOC110386633 isoform X1 [Bombyx mori]
MNYSVNNINSHIFGRSEGKIKSYKSCTDLRAWSHDEKARDRYLRDWMRSDMPVYIISVRTLVTLLKIMTCKTSGRLAPRCQPNCKSKIVLDTICTSSHIMKECLKNNQSVQDFLVKEEFETSHWPCDKCLEVLKTIKMFWKIIIEKLFHIETSNREQSTLHPATYIRVESIRSLTRTWQKDIVDDVLLIKKTTPYSNKNSSKAPKSAVDLVLSRAVDREKVDETMNVKNTSRQVNLNRECNKKSSTVGRRKTRRKLNKSTSVRLDLVDVACEANDFLKDVEPLTFDKEHIDNVHQKCDSHLNEIQKLKAENDSLKIELRNIYETHPWKYALYNKSRSGFEMDDLSPLPKPFDDSVEDGNSVNNLESEMVITMKNCCNKNFKQVSVLKVLHKTNVTTLSDSDENRSSKENPLRFLTKVHNTFGEIFKREMSLVNDKNTLVKSDFQNGFQNVTSSKSAPSCSSVSSLESNYVSMKDLNVIVQQ